MANISDSISSWDSIVTLWQKVFQHACMFYARGWERQSVATIDYISI